MANMCSTSKSKSIRDIENKYGINLTTCARYQLDRLTSKNSDDRKIKSIADLMLNAKKFDTANMTDVERANLKYLVMSTDEVLDMLKSKSKIVYHKPRNGRLRWLMSYDDFYQVCAHKLLLNDGILHFDANYKFECAIYCWIDRVAGWKSHKKVSVPDEIAILDKPCNEDSNGSTIGDLMLKNDKEDFAETDIEITRRINRILSEMDKTPSSRIIIKAGNTEIPMTEYNLAKLFMVYQLGKKELSKMLYNTTNNKLVSNQIFNKFYKQMMMHIAGLMNKEANEYGETFEIDESAL